MLKINLILIILSISCTSIAERLSSKEVYSNYMKHAALTQLHRWYQFYENDQTQIENQLDILCDNVHIKSGLGESHNQQAYKAKVLQLPKNWDNAHFVKHPDFSFNENDSIDLNIGITYLNRGMINNGDIRSASIDYQTTLQFYDGILPKFSKLLMSSSEVRIDAPSVYKDAYVENRLKSLLHYWLTIIEHPDRNPQPAKEVLADDFILNFPSTSVDNWKQFLNWFKGPVSSVKTSAHQIKHFSYRVLNNHQYQLEVELDWQGILNDGTELMAKTKHTWQVKDNPASRFAQIEQINVEILTPFQPLVDES